MAVGRVVLAVPWEMAPVFDIFWLEENQWMEVLVSVSGAQHHLRTHFLPWPLPFLLTCAELPLRDGVGSAEASG